MLKKSLKCVLAPAILLAAMVSLTSFVESGEGDDSGPGGSSCSAQLYCPSSDAPAYCTGKKDCRVGDDYVKCDGGKKMKCPKVQK